MKHLSSIFLVSGIFWACSSAPKSEDKLSSENTPTSQCYGAYTDKDSVFMKLTFVGDEVKGDLTYKLFEKDKNNGTIEALMHGDTIVGTYKFVSEGQTSTREVAFLKQGGNLVEGFAPMDETSTHFKNKNELDFTGVVLVSDNCQDL